MGILNLFALAYLATIGLVVLIYLIRKKRKTILIPSFIPWRGIKEGVVRKRFFLLDTLFFLQITILSLLTLFLAQPYITSTLKGITGKDIILLIDTSASMQTKEGEQTRLELAKSEALKIIEKMGLADKVQIISLPSSPLIVSEPIGEKGKLKRIIQNLAVTDTTSNLEEGLSLATALLRRGSSGEIYLFTDKIPADVNAFQGGKVKVIRCGKTTTNNVAIVGLDVYQDIFKEYSEREAYVTIRNMGADTKNVLLKSYLDQRPLIEETAELDPQEERTVRIRGITGPGLLKVELHPEDALTVDNYAFALIRPKKTLKVLVVSSGGIIEEELAKIDKAVEEVDFVFASPQTYNQQTPKGFAIYLFHNYVPETIPDMNSLFVLPPQENKLFPVEGWFRGAKIVDWELSHPIMRYLDYMEEIWLARTLAFKNIGGLSPVVMASIGNHPFPVAMAGLMKGKRVAVLGFDLAEFSFSKARDIPILIMFLNLLQWLDPDGTFATQVKTGKSLTIDLHEELKELSLTNPKGKTSRLEPSGNVLTIKDINYTGEYTLKGKGIERRFVANLFDREESDVRPSFHFKEEIPFEEAKAIPFSLKEKQELGQYFLIIVLVLLLAEWVLYHIKARKKAL